VNGISIFYIIHYMQQSPAHLPFVIPATTTTKQRVHTARRKRAVVNDEVK
jgi:hypothetical protein